MSAPYRIVSEIFEEGADFPAVTHIFRGKSERQAMAFLRAHLKSDSFFRSCATAGNFADFKCHEKRRLEHYRPGEGWLVVRSL